ncbi:hypothetical protein BY996DRAFT_6461996, partial [Phakopsora pachyrhizi]
MARVGVVGRAAWTEAMSKLLLIPLRVGRAWASNNKIIVGLVNGLGEVAWELVNK